MTAFSPFSPVQKADLERVLWVDFAGSQSRWEWPLFAHSGGC
jgi:hypothetical protein